MELVIALSTNATASASTPRLAPIMVRRRCLRVMSALDPQRSDGVFDPPQLVGIARQRFARIGGRSMRLVALIEHHIGAQQALPAFDIVAVMLEAVGKARKHTEPHHVA